MSHSNRYSLKLLPFLAFTGAGITWGAVSLETPPGELLATFISPNQIEESCALPRVLDLDESLTNGTTAFLPFSQAEKKTGHKVCEADFYDARDSRRGDKATVVCPKLGSTNPAVMLHELPLGMPRADFIANECSKVHGRVGDLIAKFKQSVSCSNTASILGYPRIARILHSDIELPFTAYRSMDRLEHLKVAAGAKDVAARLEGYDSLIAQTWRTIYSDDVNPAGSPRRNALYRAEDSLLYGALVPELKNDAFYFRANGSAKGDRIANFQATAAFARVSNPVPSTSKNLQELLLLREIGDLIVLDTLLNQQDRFGNIAYRVFYVRVESDGSLEWELAKKDKTKSGSAFVPEPEQAKALTGEGYVRVNRMLLADNDCGVAKENRMAGANGGAGMAAKIAHLHPDTYLAVQKLQKLATRGLLVDYLKSELLFRDQDVTRVQANLASLAKLLRAKCLAGKLFLDADVAQAFGMKPAIDSAAFCGSN